MAQCSMCLQEMKEGDGCIAVAFRFAGDDKEYEPVKYGDEPDDWGAGSGHRCHDCDCPPNSYHHPGCDVERCPRCGGQAIGCECDPEDGGAGT